MIRQRISFLLVMFFFLCKVDADIQKIDSFDAAKETLAKADNKTVVVLDVDEVLTTKKIPFSKSVMQIALLSLNLRNH